MIDFGSYKHCSIDLISKYCTPLIRRELLVEKKSTMPTNYDGNTLYVGGDGPGNYSKIQDAIDNASNGDTVFVFNGTYVENLEVNKSITIVGENKATVVLDGGNEFLYGIMIRSDNTTIMDMTIQNYTLFTAGSGVKITDSSIQNIILTNLNVVNNWHGIILCNHSSQIQNIVLTNITLHNNTDGIRLIGTTKCIVSNCIFHSNRIGMAVDTSYNNLIQNNIFHHNGLGMGMIGFQLSHYIHIVNGNTVNGKALLYFKNQTDLLLDNEAGQIILANCSNVHIRNLTLNDTSFGVYTAFSDNITISDNSFSRSSIMLDKSKDSIIISNNIYDNHNCVGIGIVFSNNNKIISNTIHNHDFKAIQLYSSNNNIIRSNTIYNNELGIDLSSSNYNMIYHNNLNNTQNAADECNNTWDNGYPSGGNYWDDYTGKDNDGDGIGDTPYPIPDSDNKDSYPLMFQYGEESDVKIISPVEGFLYIRNLKIRSLFTTLIFGKITIKVNAVNYIYGIEKVEFYVDNILRKIDTDPPYSWRWRLSSHIRHRHTIKVVAYDTTGASIDDDLKVWRFL